MTHTEPSSNLAARMGRWSASHWKTATFGWLAFVVASFAIGNAVGTKTIDQNASGSGESGHVLKVLSSEFKQPASENVLIRSTTHTTADPTFRAAVADVASTLASQHAVRRHRVARSRRATRTDLERRHAALVQFQLRGTKLSQSDKDVLPVEAAVDKARRRRIPHSRSASSATQASTSNSTSRSTKDFG